MTEQEVIKYLEDELNLYNITYQRAPHFTLRVTGECTHFNSSNLSNRAQKLYVTTIPWGILQVELTISLYLPMMEQIREAIEKDD